ncbi:hypothetical protein E4U32_007030 [Claviceps aff. humidiphila group G2b]|nr:hypothetical protein E4U32_007030 [Claviceps aff. humidiphila group G2b]
MPPNTFIKAMNMALEGQAATYVDTCSELLRSIGSRASRSSATQDHDDLADFRRALTDRYHPLFVDEPARITSSNFEMRQDDDEPLFAYHTGGKDKPSGDDTPLFPSEKYILNDFIQRFIQGLADKSLMQEAISQNVLAGREGRIITRWLVFPTSSAQETNLTVGAGEQNWGGSGRSVRAENQQGHPEWQL